LSPRARRRIIAPYSLSSQNIHGDDSVAFKGSEDIRGPMTMPDLLPIGADAPDLTLPAADGQMITLSALAGRKHVVLVFYVGDNTPD
jgi:hypothetical protein